MTNDALKLTAEVTIDGKKLSDSQVLALSALVQAFLLTQPKGSATLTEAMSVQLNEINRMLCGEES